MTDAPAERRRDGAPRHRLPSRARLHSQKEFQRVYSRGNRATGEWITVVALRRRDDDGMRLGVSVSKDHGAAVRRNKIKRLLREAFRLERPALPKDLDVVLIPRQHEAKFALATLRAEFVQLIARIQAGRGKPNARRHPQ